MTHRRRERGGPGYPVGWGVQPFDDDNVGCTWQDLLRQGSWLRVPIHIEAGGPIIEEPSPSFREFKGQEGPREPQRKQCGGKYAGMLGQCWCGKDYGVVTPEMVRDGETISCGRQRCDLIARMSPRERLRRRPRRRDRMGRVRVRRSRAA